MDKNSTLLFVILLLYTARDAGYASLALNAFADYRPNPEIESEVMAKVLEQAAAMLQLSNLQTSHAYERGTLRVARLAEFGNLFTIEIGGNRLFMLVD